MARRDDDDGYPNRSARPSVRQGQQHGDHISFGREEDSRGYVSGFRGRREHSDSSGGGEHLVHDSYSEIAGSGYGVRPGRSMGGQGMGRGGGAFGGYRGRGSLGRSGRGMSSDGSEHDREGNRGWYGTEQGGPVAGYGMGSSGAQTGGMARGKGPKGYTRSDERIREDVCDCLTDDAHLDAGEIEVEVKSGEVILNGTVSDRHAKRHAEDLIDQVSGVKHVQNNLRVQKLNSSSGEQSTSGNGSGNLSSVPST